jgi:integrase
MVWTPEQTAVFLKAAGRHRLHALWRLTAVRGLRRGEGCGLRRADTDLSVALTTVRWQITQLGWKTVQGAPKSDAGDRTVALDTVTVADIRRHRREQGTEREKAGGAWVVSSGFEFTDEQGCPLHPADVTYAFHMIAYLAGLPPVRLHDLRHGAATLQFHRRAARPHRSPDSRPQKPDHHGNVHSRLPGRPDPRLPRVP